MITFVTVSCAGIEQLNKTINSLSNQTSANWNQVILCDNESFTQIKDLLSRHYYEYLNKIKVITVEFSENYAAIVNIGIRATDSLYIQIMDADEAVSDGFVSEIESQLLNNSNTIFYCNVLIAYEHTIMNRPFILGQRKHPANEKYLSSVQLILEPSNFMIPIVFPREILNKTGLLKEDGGYCPLWDHVISLTKYTKFQNLYCSNYVITINKKRENNKFPRFNDVQLLNFRYKYSSGLYSDITSFNYAFSMQIQLCMHLYGGIDKCSYSSIFKPRYNLVVKSFLVKLIKLFLLINKRIFKKGAR